MSSWDDDDAATFLQRLASTGNWNVIKLGVTADDLRRLEKYIAGFGRPDVVVARDTQMQNALLGRLAKIIKDRRESFVASLGDDDKTPTVDRSEDPTEPDGKIVPPKDEQH